MTADDTGITVIVPTRNRRTQLEITLSPILADVAVSEVVVVNDGSSDDTDAYLAQVVAGDGRVRVIAGPTRGAGWARQAGAEAAAGDLLLFIDDDVVARPGLAAAHLRAHRNNRGVVIVGYMPVAAPLMAAPDAVVARIYQGDYEAQVACYETDPTAVLREMWGGNFSMTRADALRIGLGQRTGVLYHEDRELGIRCLKGGLVGVFDRSLAADHFPVRSLRSFFDIARNSGRDVQVLYLAFPDVLDPVDLQTVGAELPAALGVALVAARSKALTNGTLVVLEQLVPRLRRRQRTQTAVAVLARSIATRRGILDARRDPPIG